ncbi:MAG: hypothetical protein RR977_05170, partial [Oscillospiraceae bacterium]
MARFLKNRKKTQGAAPGSLIFIGKQKMNKNSIHVLQYTADEIKEFSPESMKGITKNITNDRITWINISGLHDTN